MVYHVTNKRKNYTTPF